MGLAQSPKTVTNGLVFYYDQNNIKSYKGPAVQNLLTQITPTGYTATGISITTGSEIVNIPQIGDSQVQYSVIQNNYTSFTPNSADCCPRPFRYSGEYGAGGFVIQASTLYTYGIVYKVTSGYTHANYMYRYEFTSNGGSYVTEAGVHSDSNRIHLGDGWYWAWGTFTTQATTNWINLAGAWYYRYSDKSDKLSIAKVLMVKGDYTQLHPKYWPDVNTTRSNTQAIIDPISKTTITANNMSYANTGSISFNGSTSYFDCGNLSAFQLSTTVTLEAWIKPNSTSGLGNMISKNMNAGYRFRIQSGELMCYSNGNAAVSSGANLSNGSWWHCVATFGPTGIYGYVNGSLVASSVTAYTPSDVVSNPLLIGCYWPSSETVDGIIDSARVYNRVLSQAEIQQNFNALRGRYGI